MFDFSMTRMTIWVPMLTNYVLFFRMVEAAKYNHIQFTIFHECVAIKLVSLVEPISNPTFNGDLGGVSAYVLGGFFTEGVSITKTMFFYIFSLQ